MRFMTSICVDMKEDRLDIFMDDFLVYMNSFTEYLSNQEKVLERSKDTNLVLNLESYHFMVNEGIVLGHQISKKRLELEKAKIEVIEKLPHPMSIHEIQNFPSHRIL